MLGSEYIVRRQRQTLAALAVQLVSGMSGHEILAGCEATASRIQPAESAAGGYRHHGSGGAKVAMTKLFAIG
jgi:hypothetical protein